MPSPADAPAPRTPSDSPRRILVVEDDRALRQVIVTILQIKRFDVASAATVAAALPLLRDHAPDYLILDLNLPDGCGLTVFEEVRRLQLPTRVAVATGTTDRSLLDRAIAMNPAEILHKPFRASDLTRWLRHWVDDADPPPVPSRTAPRSRARARTGVTMIEAVIATIIVAVMLTAALQAVAAARAGDYKVTSRSRGQFLAQALLSEIIDLPYRDPNPSPAFGPEAGESRPAFDDVDDYLDYQEPSPRDKAGNLLPKTGGWTRSVKVERVPIDALTGPASTSETGIKRITVTASLNNRPATSLTAFATDSP